MQNLKIFSPLLGFLVVLFLIYFRICSFFRKPIDIVSLNKKTIYILIFFLFCILLYLLVVFLKKNNNYLLLTNVINYILIPFIDLHLFLKTNVSLYGKFFSFFLFLFEIFSLLDFYFILIYLFLIFPFCIIVTTLYFECFYFYKLYFIFKLLPLLLFPLFLKLLLLGIIDLLDTNIALLEKNLVFFNLNANNKDIYFSDIFFSELKNKNYILYEINRSAIVDSNLTSLSTRELVFYYFLLKLYRKKAIELKQICLNYMYWFSIYRSIAYCFFLIVIIFFNINVIYT